MGGKAVSDVHPEGAIRVICEVKLCGVAGRVTQGESLSTSEDTESE